MYTQCPKCETVFRLSAQVLRAASGQVRCGKCGDVFNALARLAENAADLPKGESSFELETRADAILDSPPPPPTEEDLDLELSGPELAHLEILATDPDLADELSLEFTLPPGDLDRIFVETSPSPLQLLKSKVHVDAAHPAPLYVTPMWVELPPAVTPATPIVSAAVPTSIDGTHGGIDPAASSTELALPVMTAARPVGLHVSDAVRAAMIAGYAPTALPDLVETRRRVPPAAWATAAVVLALLLLLQFSNGAEWPGSKPAAPTAYQLRQWGVTGNPEAKGTLRVRAGILNASAQLQPYPLLRVTLADRFGARIGQREFEPAEYLGKAATRELAPGERVDAAVDILDPGKDAEGFEIDVCLRASHRRITCAGDAQPPAK